MGYRVAWDINKVLQFAHAAYKEEAHDIVVEKTDMTVETMSENKIDKLYWESQRSWHKGAGQLRFDAPKVSDPNAFLLSQGVDVRIPGQATLVSEITNQHTAVAPWVFSTSLAPRLAVASDIIFQEDSTVLGTNDGFRGVTLANTDAGAATLKSVRAGSASGVGVQDVCSDGQTLYFAIPDDAVPKITSLGGIAAGGSVGSIYASGGFGTGTVATDAHVIAWVKNQLVAVGLQSTGATLAQNVWRIFTVGAGAGTGASKEILLLPPGYTVLRNCITEIAGFVLFGARSNRQSVIYAWDGATTPYVCAVLPTGDTITSMSSYLGIEVLIGCQRVKSTGTGATGTGILYVGQVAAAGQLILQEVVEIADSGVPWPIATAADAFDYSITSIVPRGRYSYFTWQPFGLGVYDHANQSYSRFLGNLQANAGSLLNGGTPLNASASIGDIVVCQRRLAFSWGQGTSTNPLYVENISKLVSAGQILGSVMDWNIDKPKSINQAEFGFSVTAGGPSVTMAYSMDQGTTSTFIATAISLAAGSGTFTTSATSAPPANFFVTSNTINYLITLNSDGGHTLTPTLKKVGFGAWYGSKPTIEWNIYLMADDRMTTKAGTPYVLTGSGGGVIGPDPKIGDKIAQKFRDLRNTQAIVDWQPPGWGDTRSDSYKVQVRGYNYYRWSEPGIGPGGAAIQIALKQAP